MTVALAMFTDGRDHIFDDARRVSWGTRLHGGVARRIIFDDSNDEPFRERLLWEFPDWMVVSWTSRQGFGGTIRKAWAMLSAMEGITHVFHLEDDFRLMVDVDLDVMVGILERHPHLAQVALGRNPVNSAEVKAGGVVEQLPHLYDQSGDDYAQWLEHRLYFTTNPCLYRASLLRVGWPDCPQSEGHFTHHLLEAGSPEAGSDLVRFAVLGKRFDHVQVEHIGKQRIGTGY